MSNSRDGHRPMKPANFHILLVLGEESAHGLGIAKAVDAVTEGAMILGPGTLYRALKELMTDALITEIDPPESGGDPRRRFYEITPEGRARARAEAERLETLVRVAQRNAILPGER